MLFETFLQELARAMNFTDLKPDGDGACLVVLKEDDIPLLFEFDDQLVPNTILLSAPIETFPSELRAVIYEALLVGNNFIEETLSVKPDEDLVYLHIRLHPASQAPEIQQTLKSFVSNIKEWRQKVETLSNKRASVQKSSIPPPTFKVLPYKG